MNFLSSIEEPHDCVSEHVNTDYRISQETQMCVENLIHEDKIDPTNFSTVPTTVNSREHAQGNTMRRMTTFRIDSQVRADSQEGKSSERSSTSDDSSQKSSNDYYTSTWFSDDRSMIDDLEHSQMAHDIE